MKEYLDLLAIPAVVAIVLLLLGVLVCILSVLGQLTGGPVHIPKLKTWQRLALFIIGVGLIAAALFRTKQNLHYLEFEHGVFVDAGALVQGYEPLTLNQRASFVIPVTLPEGAKIQGTWLSAPKNNTDLRLYFSHFEVYPQDNSHVRVDLTPSQAGFNSKLRLVVLFTQPTVVAQPPVRE